MQLGSLFHEAARKFYSSATPSAPSGLYEALKTHGLDSDNKSKLCNAITLLAQNRWSEFEVVAVEEPFFLELASDLPPIIGVADLILREGATVTVVDHKTSTKFNDLDSDQLVLYAEHARRRHGARRTRGFFDEYRLVPNLSTIRTPAFRRSPVQVGKTLLSPMIERYREAWDEILDCESGDESAPGYECWTCRNQRFGY
jgi:hypothetical protein